MPDVFNKVNLDYTSECFDKTESNGEYTLTFRELPNGQSVMQGKIGLKHMLKRLMKILMQKYILKLLEK